MEVALSLYYILDRKGRFYAGYALYSKVMLAREGGNPLFCDSMNLDTLRVFKPQLLHIAEAHHASDLRVFGSVVRGEAHAQSDVDFLVKMLPGASLMDIVVLAREFTELLHMRVDVVPDDSIHPVMEAIIRSEAIPL